MHLYYFRYLQIRRKNLLLINSAARATLYTATSRHSDTKYSAEAHLNDIIKRGIKAQVSRSRSEFYPPSISIYALCLNSLM